MLSVEERIGTYPDYIEPFHVDFAGRVYPGVLCNDMLNAAGKHSGARGWGITELMKDRHTWVLSRFSVELNRIPVTGEMVNISTWVNHAIKLFTTRFFSLTLPDGTPLGYGRSIWAMINTETRKPADLLTFRDGDLLNWIVTEDEKPCPIAEMKTLRIRNAQPTREVQTHYSDVAINGHINSMKYVEHIVNLLSHEQLVRGVKRLDIAYKTESYGGDVLSLYTEWEKDDEVLLVDVKKPSGETAVQARITLFPKE